MLHGRQVELFLVVKFLDREVGDVGVAVKPRSFSFLSHVGGARMRKPLSADM